MHLNFELEDWTERLKFEVEFDVEVWSWTWCLKLKFEVVIKWDLALLNWFFGYQYNCSMTIYDLWNVS